jgi:predicted regulator of Ras-like GTPase activity (Roadblock/LC7/MglB family)
MTGQQDVSRDIFRGAEKIEILGKLPGLLWAYIDTSRKLMKDLKTRPDGVSESVGTMQKMLGILHAAADHLENQKLKDHLARQSKMMTDLSQGALSSAEFIDAFAGRLPILEQLAGQRVESSASFLNAVKLDLEVEKAERVKTGRSADLVVSGQLLDDIRDYLQTEVLSEGISSVLIIDNAGALIASVGSKPVLDVTSLAAVAAANFAATQEIARLIGESDFVLLFYKGHNESFHFSRVGKEYIIVTVFQNTLSLGLLRLKIAEVSTVLQTKLPKREA